MVTWKHRAVNPYLSTLFKEGSLGDLSDGQVLERFATGKREAAELAFAALVERHGPMVLSGAPGSNQRHRSFTRSPVARDRR